MIIGAGLAGLISAYLFPGHDVMERGSPTEQSKHLALLRFRSPAISEATGIPFRQVTVHKGIWLDGEWQQPTIRNANLYAQKVVGRLVDRSIWDLTPVQRWIAPPDFYARLVDGLATRIVWNTDINGADIRAANEPVISTIPMPALLGALGVEHGFEFSFSPIFVRRYRIPGADVHQTVYFPGGDTPLYRASITGDTLICEFVRETEMTEGWDRDLTKAFALEHGAVEEVPVAERCTAQQYGKIVPVDDSARKATIMKLTMEGGVYSLGRYATWRNILLDDVLKDAAVIKRLIAGSDYERRMYY